MVKAVKEIGWQKVETFWGTIRRSIERYKIHDDWINTVPKTA